jgi:hypothetical protein
MRTLLRVLGVILLATLLVILHMAAASWLPAPWNAVNSIMVVCLSILIREEKGWVVWVSFACHSIIELYTKTPFGVLLTAGTFSLLFGYWIYSYVFTNQSWYSSLALVAMVMMMYRLMYTIAIVIISFITHEAQIITGVTVMTYVSELLLTSLGVLFISFIITRGASRQPGRRNTFFTYGS